MQKCVPSYQTSKNFSIVSHYLDYISQSSAQFAFDNGCAASWEYSSFKEDGSACAIVFLKGGKYISLYMLIESFLNTFPDFQNKIPDLHNIASELTVITSSALSIRCFYLSGSEIPGTTPLHVGYLEHFTHSNSPPADYLNRPIFGDEVLPVTHIPCRVISSSSRDDWEVAICIVTAPKSQ